jgi:hypothetical protein
VGPNPTPTPNVFVKHEMSMKKLELLDVPTPKVELSINKHSITADIDTQSDNCFITKGLLSKVEKNIKFTGQRV